MFDYVWGLLSFHMKSVTCWKVSWLEGLNGAHHLEDLGILREVITSGF